MSIQRLVRQLPVPDKVVEAILKLVRSARPGTGAGADTDRLIAWGPGPRASQALMLAVRAKALIDGRLAPSVDDVDRAGGAGAQAPHGADVRGTRGGRDGQRRHQPPGGSAGVRRVAARKATADVNGSGRARRASSGSKAKRRRLPTVCPSCCSRPCAWPIPWRTASMAAAAPEPARRSGSSASSRPAIPPAVIDWRRSASSDHLYVREREWEAAHTFWLWPDMSPSMAFQSHLAPISKRDRALVLTLAMAELLVRGGRAHRAARAHACRWRAARPPRAWPRRWPRPSARVACNRACRRRRA